MTPKRKHMGITIQPKIKKKFVKPKTMVVDTRELNKVKMFALDSFWSAWEEEKFDLNLMSAFYKEAPQLKKDEVLNITDGKSVVSGYRLNERTALLSSGRTLERVYSQTWAEKNGFIFVPHRKVKLGLDKKRHFIERYRSRNFDLGLVVEFIIRAPMGKLGQRIKILSENDVLVGARTNEYGSILITGMKRGEIDLGEYCDWKF